MLLILPGVIDPLTLCENVIGKTPSHVHTGRLSPREITCYLRRWISQSATHLVRVRCTPNHKHRAPYVPIPGDGDEQWQRARSTHGGDVMGVAEHEQDSIEVAVSLRLLAKILHCHQVNARHAVCGAQEELRPSPLWAACMQFGRITKCCLSW